VPLPKRLPCYCYIVECVDGSFYTGWTTNPEQRLQAHNAGRGSRYTRSRRPVRLVLLEHQADRISAMKRERAIKAMTRSRKMQLIAQPPKAPGKRKNRRRRVPTPA
jgi:putative endonuclease